jgi:hypothetical protein
MVTDHATAPEPATAQVVAENPPRIFTVGNRTFTDYREFILASDRRFEEFAIGCGVDPTELERLPKRVIPEGATPENYNPEPHWPIAEAIDAALKKRYRLFSGGQLNAEQSEPRYLIPGILAAGQVGGIYGGFKTLKTSIAADLMISLASGTPFLGRFPVPQPGKVLFLSGESGLTALRSIARRICAERGLSLESLDNFVISPDLPRLDHGTDMMALDELVEREKPICVVIDPFYLARWSGTGRTVPTGQLLRTLTDLCNSTGCTVLVVHHCKRAHKLGNPATLDDVAGRGFGEYSAQWLTVARRRPYDPDTGHHELWLTVGGRAGHHGLWALDVEEGTSPPLSEDGPVATRADARRWTTKLRSVAWAEARADEHWVGTVEDRRLRRRALAVERQGERVLDLLAAYPEDCTARFMREILGQSGDRINRILDALIAKGRVVKNEDLFDRKRPIVTYARVETSDLASGSLGIRTSDQKVYDRGTGQFVERKSPPTSGTVKCLNVAGMCEAAEVRRQLLASGPHALQAKQQELLAAYEARANAAPPAVPETQATCVPSVGRDTGHEIQIAAGRDTNEQTGHAVAGAPVAG